MLLAGFLYDEIADNPRSLAYTAGFLKGACPIVGSYGGKDRSLRGTAGRLDRALTAAGVEHDVKEYPGGPHVPQRLQSSGDKPPLLAVVGKLTPGMGCHEESAQDARRQIIAFFDAHPKT